VSVQSYVVTYGSICRYRDCMRADAICMRENRTPRFLLLEMTWSAINCTKYGSSWCSPASLRRHLRASALPASSLPLIASSDPITFRRVGAEDLFYVEDVVVDFDDVINENLPKYVCSSLTVNRVSVSHVL